ncbi:hypothetical protein BASA61_005405 [Batrachochytrium salamandrivorans]|nr:hypothetical protein BASA61_005405 [Batrachochytrium salamandrivorans]
MTTDVEIRPVTNWKELLYKPTTNTKLYSQSSTAACSPYPPGTIPTTTTATTASSSSLAVVLLPHHTHTIATRCLLFKCPSSLIPSASLIHHPHHHLD